MELLNCMYRDTYFHTKFATFIMKESANKWSLGSTFFPWFDSPQWASASSLKRLHDQTQNIPHSVGLLWTRDRPVAETYT
jgi:hypothetical protein